MFPTNGVRVYLALGATDMRKAIHGLSILVSQQLQLEPFADNLFGFCNRNLAIIKLLYWDATVFSCGKSVWSVTCSLADFRGRADRGSADAEDLRRDLRPGPYTRQVRPPAHSRRSAQGGGRPLPEAEKVCPCGAALTRIGEEVSEKLDIVPAKIQVIRHIRPNKYACLACEGVEDDGPTVKLHVKCRVGRATVPAHTLWTFSMKCPFFFKWITPWRLPSSLRLKWSGTHRGPCWASFMN